MDMNYKPNPEYLVEVNNLKMYFPVKTGFFGTTPLKAADGVSFAIRPGETLGLVGESGCGKTTVGRALIRLYKPTDGDIFFEGKRVDDKSIGGLRKDMQMVFQDPYSSLNPRMTVEDSIGEPLDVHKMYTSRADRRDQILSLMEMVGLNAEHATRYAHEFSGGQRQRIGIARALATKPKFRSRLRSSTCSRTCRGSWASRTCSSPMTFWSYTTSPTGSQSCTWGSWWRLRIRMS